MNTDNTTGTLRKKGNAFSQYPIITEGACSDDYLPGDGIRKDTEVRVIEEVRENNQSRQGEETDLARALYGQPGVKGKTEIEYGNSWKGSAFNSRV